MKAIAQVGTVAMTTAMVPATLEGTAPMVGSSL